MRHAMVLAGTVLALGSGVCAWELPPRLYVYDVHKTKTPPKIDGRLDDACWKTAPPMTDFTLMYTDPRPVKKQTVAGIVYDDQNIYMGIRLIDPDVERIKATTTARDASIWRDDCVEIYFEKGQTGKQYYKFSTNFLCTKVDMIGRVGALGLELDLSWGDNSQWYARAGKDPGGWNLEIAIPFSDLGFTPKPGQPYRFDLIRFCWSGPKQEYGSWAPGASYMNPENFGYLLFGGQMGRLENDMRTWLRRIGRGPRTIAGHRGLLCYVEYIEVARAQADETKQRLDAVDRTLTGVRHLPKRVAQVRQAMERVSQDFARIQARLAAKTEPSPMQLRQLMAELDTIAARATELDWQGRLLELCDDQVGP